MAEETKKRRKPQGPRTIRPVFAIVRYADGEGNMAPLDASRLNIEIERDSSKLLEALLPGGAGMSASAVVRVVLPAGPPRNKPEAAPAA